MIASTPEEALMDIEQILQSTLRPIQPDPGFLGKLNQRLTAPTNVVLEQPPSRWRGVLLVSIGLFAGLVLLTIFQRGRG